MTRFRALSFVAVCSLSSLAAVPATAVPQVEVAGVGVSAAKIPYFVQQLVKRIDQRLAQGLSAESLSSILAPVMPDGRIGLTIHSATPIVAGNLADLRALGATVTDRLSNAAMRLVPTGLASVLIGHDRVDDLADLAWVGAIAPDEKASVDPHPANGAVSEGVALHNADDVQTRGATGAGVTVGAMSDGVSNLITSQNANELPAVNVLSVGAGDEGTAMLEIIHDVAPGAALVFDDGAGLADYNNSLTNLAANGSNVITEDLFFFGEPAFQQGSAAQTGEAIANGGVAMHSSAGNRGQTHTARVNAVGTGGGPDGVAFGGTPAGCANTPDNVVGIAPAGDSTFDLTLANPDNNGNSTIFTLQWSEPRAIFPTVGQGGFTDLNLYVMDAALTQCLGQSVGAQANGTGDTIEQIVMPGALAGTNVKVVVDVQGTSSAVAAPILDLRWNRSNNIDAPTRRGSINPDSNYIGNATSQAAVNGNNGALEGFSSAGPVQLVTTTMCPGGGPGPCAGVAGPAPVTANGPNWAAADGVEISGTGGFGTPCATSPSGRCFFGTSASTPHSAGCDALVRSELGNAAAAPATTNAILASSALDIDTPGVDVNTGAGTLDCLQAVNDPPTADAGGPYVTDEGIDVVVDGSGSTDPDAGDSLTYAWDLDNDAIFETPGISATFTDVGQDGASTICLRVTDTAQDTDVDCTTVTVLNVEPAVSGLTEDGPHPELGTVQIEGSVSDPGWEDDLSVEIDWGDGTAAQTVGGLEENLRPDATLAFAATHVYGDDGTFTVEVCGSDDDSTTCETMGVTFTNVDPTATWDMSGAVDVNGTPTIIAEAGESVDFAGNVTDPGSDDETISMDWDDGVPSPDELEISRVNPPFIDPDPSASIQPRDVDMLRTHAFADACIYEIILTAADDDGGFDDDKASVLIAGNADRTRPTGWWHRQYMSGGAQSDFDQATLACYLEITRFGSAQFDEHAPLATFAQAETTLLGGSGARHHLRRELLTAWLNLANGGVGYLEVVVDTDGDGVADASFEDVVTAAETVLADATATAAQLDAQRQRVHRLNVPAS